MEMTISIDWVPDEHGWGSWHETNESVRNRIADRFGFQRNLIELDDESIFYNGCVAEECDFTVMGIRYNVRFHFGEPEKSRVTVY